MFSAVLNRLLWVEHFCSSKLVIQRTFILSRICFQFCVVFKPVRTFRLSLKSCTEKKFFIPPFGINFSKDICKLIVILGKDVLPCFCASSWQLLNVRRSGMLLCGVPTRNSAPIPSSTQNRNSTRVGTKRCKRLQWYMKSNNIKMLLNVFSTTCTYPNCIICRWSYCWKIT